MKKKKTLGVIVALCVFVSALSLPASANTVTGPSGTASISCISSSRTYCALYWSSSPNTNWYYNFIGTISLLTNDSSRQLLLSDYVSGVGIAHSTCDGQKGMLVPGRAAGTTIATLEGTATDLMGDRFVILPGCYTLV